MAQAESKQMRIAKSISGERRRPQARVQPVLRWTRESLTQSEGYGVVPVLAVDPAADLRPLHALGCEGSFHFTHRMSVFCAEACSRVQALRHIDPERVLVTFIRCRSRRKWGLQARLVPLRFRGGRATEVRGQHRYRVQQVFVGQTQMRYVLSFYLPRFMDQSFDEKLVTIFHELYHIHPRFNGDVRRFDDPDEVHGGSQQCYDRQMAKLAREYLRSKPPQCHYDFLRMSFDDIERSFGEVVGLQIPTPKLIPIQRVG